MSLIISLHPLDARGREVLDAFPIGPYLRDLRSGECRYAFEARDMTVERFEAELDSAAPDWREHLEVELA